jgi:Fic family protein
MADSFHVEGLNATAGEWRRMCWQCVRALKFLLTHAELTPDAVVAAHRMMMEGARGLGAGHGEGTMPGLRIAPARAGDYGFCPASELEEGMRRLVDRFESAMRMGKYGAHVAADLVLDFVTLHPFENGNGRMCRLLFAYALRRAGLPASCCITSGDEPLKDYIKAIRRAQTRDSDSARYDMYWLAVFSVGAAVQDARGFMHLGNCKRPRQPHASASDAVDPLSPIQPPTAPLRPGEPRIHKSSQ